MSDWRDCIVILIDLIGVKRLASKGNSRASDLMRCFHEAVRQEMRTGLTSLDHAYVWNDAVLLLAYADDRSGALQESLRDAARLKRRVDIVAQSYAIAVKGQVFPRPSRHIDHDTRVTVIRASSYAMANCFEIEAEVKRKKLRKAWYVDERIVNELHMNAEESITVELLPSSKGRKIYMYSGECFASSLTNGLQQEPLSPDVSCTKSKQLPS